MCIFCFIVIIRGTKLRSCVVSLTCVYATTSIGKFVHFVFEILASKKIFGDVSESDNDDDEDVKIKLESASATDGGAAGGGGASDSNLDYSLPTAAMTEGRRQCNRCDVICL